MVSRKRNLQMTTTRFNRLLKKIHNGEIQALEYIYSEYFEVMVVTAQNILGDESDARDAATDVIHKLLKQAMNNAKIKVKDVGAYLHTSVINAANTIYSKRKNLVSLDCIEDIPDVNDALIITLDNVALQSAINVLEPLDKKIVEMYYFYNMKIATIAASLTMPEGTVKWKLSEIRKKLYDFLK